MTYYIGIPLVVLLALIETSVLPMFRIAGLQPNLSLVVLVSWMMVRGQREALVLIPIAGIFIGLVDGAPMGAALLALAPIALLYDLRQVHLGEGQFSMTILFTLLATIIYEAVYLFVYVLYGDAGGIPTALSRIVLPTALMNIVWAVPVYFLIWMFSADTRRAAFA